jgi:hypothetical protein
MQKFTSCTGGSGILHTSGSPELKYHETGVPEDNDRLAACQTLSEFYRVLLGTSGNL